jgi:hypothetical protein
VTRRSILEYAQAAEGRYRRSSKREKTKILDEFTQNTGLHRKAVIRLLNRASSRMARVTVGERKKRGRPPLYESAVVAALKICWEAVDCLCSRRLRPFLPELVRVLKEKGELRVSEETEARLCALSASSIDRITRRWRHRLSRRGLATTKPGTLLKNAIPIKTFTEWEDTRPGFIEADLVAHCGESVEGFYLTTLSTVDVATGWCEPVAVWGKGQERVGGAVHRVRERLPMPLLGLDSDNGSEFINQGMFEYCKRNHITFTRSRSYRKNDSCHVEQKNWSVVRQEIGYLRFSSRVAYEALDSVYVLLRLYINFFKPVLKLIGKSRHGARVKKAYDKAQTPYQRLLASGVLTPEKKQILANIYGSLNPVALRKQIGQAVEYLWTLAEKEAAK